MPRLRIIFIASLVILAVIVSFMVFRPMAAGEKYSEIANESIIKREDQWIIQFQIINMEGKDTNYTINWYTKEETYSKPVLIKDGRRYTYIYHVYPEAVPDGKLDLAVYREGEATPFEQATYYIDFN